MEYQKLDTVSFKRKLEMELNSIDIRKVYRAIRNDVSIRRIYNNTGNVSIAHYTNAILSQMDNTYANSIKFFLLNLNDGQFNSIDEVYNNYAKLLYEKSNVHCSTGKDDGHHYIYDLHNFEVYILGQYMHCFFNAIKIHLTFNTYFLSK